MVAKENKKVVVEAAGKPELEEKTKPVKKKEKIIKRLADFSLNELNYLARILGIK